MRTRDWFNPILLYDPTIPADPWVYMWGAVIYPAMIVYSLTAFLVMGLLILGYDSAIVLFISSTNYLLLIVGLFTNPLSALKRLKDAKQSGWIVLSFYIPWIGKFIQLVVAIDLLLAPSAYAKVANQVNPDASSKPPADADTLPPPEKSCCQRCGEALDMNANYCTQCGERITSAAMLQPNPSN